MKLSMSKLAITTGLLGGVVAVTTFGTMALFTDSDAVDANTFSTGTIALSTNPTTALVTFSNMMPGDAVTNPVVVSNTGTESLRYAVGSVSTNTDSKGLKDQLVLEVRTIDFTTPVSPCNDFDGPAVAAAAAYTGDLDSSAGKILGDVATGQNGVAASGGDRVLASSTSETLCFRVSLPIATGNAFQGAATTATFTFASEQTKNN
jgi:predicted ribosomally synthesized peptide with SipW-like signal peptide